MATSGWSIPLDLLARRVNLDIQTVARKSTLDVFTAIKLRSPVLTGRFRANWNVSFGAPNLSTTTSTLSGRIDTEILKSASLPLGGVIYMSNGLPYAEKLEYGYSQKAPAGMVRITSIEFDRYVQMVIR